MEVLILEVSGKSLALVQLHRGGGGEVMKFPQVIGGDHGPIYLVDQNWDLTQLGQIRLTQFLGKAPIFGTCNLSDKV